MRREDVERLAGDLAGEVCAGRGLSLVDCTFRKSQGSWRLLVRVDKASGVSVQDCAAVSQTLSDKLDETDPIEGSYTLEVSSVGLSEPLRTDNDFQRFVGRRVELQLTPGWREGRADRHHEAHKPDEVAGLLAAFDVHTLSVETGDGSYRIGRGFVRRARPGVDFKGAGAREQ
ncbi:MAG: ribosome maturation factor RimP [Bacillota bacterium]|nr:ribosome maturation factor RimP [Bacillota bacterium]